MTALTVGVALAAAVAFGWSTALMHHSASGAPREAGGPIALLRHVVVQWRWLVGMAASLIGLGLHALALHLGSLVLVQPLVVTGLVFSFVFRAALDRHLLPRPVIGWALVTAAGLVVFLVALRSTTGSGQLDGPAAAAMFSAGAIVAGAAWWSSLGAAPAHCGLLLGVSGGVVFGLIAGALKATTSAASHGVQLFTSWPLYVLAALGTAGFLLNQRAYHQAPLATSLPALNMVNPLVAVLFGVVAFHERPSDSAVTIAAQGLGLATVLAGIFFLSRQSEIATQT